MGLPLSFLRFKKNPPTPKEATPADRIDAYYDPAVNKFVARDFRGNPVYFDTASGGGGGTTVITGTTTNDNAAAGYLGEYKEDVVPVEEGAAIVNDIGVSVCSLSLGAGDWEVEGQMGFEGDGAADVTLLQVEFDTISGQTLGLPGASIDTTVRTNFATILTMAPLRRRFSLSATTTVHLNAYATYSGGVFGITQAILTARRVR